MQEAVEELAGSSGLTSLRKLDLSKALEVRESAKYMSLRMLLCSVESPEPGSTAKL